MDTIEQWEILLLEMPGDRFIGGDHEFLYDPVGNVALGAHYIFRRSLNVEDNFRLWEIEIQVASASATFVNQYGQLFHKFELINQTSITRQGLGIFINQDFPYAGIGHALLAPNHGVKETTADHFTFAVDFHSHTFGEPVLVGIQATDAVGKSLRKHGDSSIRKIDAGSPTVGLLIQRSSWSDVVRDVSDGDEQFVMTVGLPDGNGVVKIPRLFAINSNDRQMSQIRSRRNLVFINDEGPARDFPVHVLGKSRCEPVTKDDRLDLNLGIIGVSHYLHEFSLWSRHGRTISGNLCSNDFALCGFRRGRLQRDSRANARIHGNEIDPAIEFIVGPDDPLLRTLKNLHDVGFYAAACLLIGAHQHSISMHYATHFAAIEVKILRTLAVGNEKTETVRVGVDASSHQILCVWQPIVIFL